MNTFREVRDWDCFDSKYFVVLTKHFTLLESIYIACKQILIGTLVLFTEGY